MACVWRSVRRWAESTGREKPRRSNKESFEAPCRRAARRLLVALELRCLPPARLPCYLLIRGYCRARMARLTVIQSSRSGPRRNRVRSDPVETPRPGKADTAGGNEQSNANCQIGELFLERAAPCLRIADMFVQLDRPIPAD
jgi:hypothetical protein